MWLALAILASTAPIALAHPASYNSTDFDWAKTKYLITFGDSYTYVQGTKGLQNYSFIGDFQNFSYTPEILFEDRIVQNQTATAEGGPNWVEFLTGCGLKPGLTDPRSCSRQLWDFAFAGADISQQYTALHHPYTVPMVNQTQQFAMYAQPALAKVVSAPETLWTNVSFPTFYDTLISTEFAAIEQNVWSQGYRNYLFMNLPPLDRTPGNLARAAGPAPNKTMIDWWDSTLQTHADHFAASHPDTNVMVFDVNTFLNGVMDNAADYGIKNITGYCASYDQPFINTNPAQYDCLPLPEYFWFNDGHATSHVHQILAEEVESFLRNQSSHGSPHAY